MTHTHETVHAIILVAAYYRRLLKPYNPPLALMKEFVEKELFS